MEKARRIKFRISHKLLALFLILAILPIIFFGYYMVTYTRKARLNEISEIISTSMQYEQNQVIQYWQNLGKVLNLTAQNNVDHTQVNQLSYLMDNYDSNNISTSNNYQQQTEKLDTYFNKIKTDYVIYDILILNKQGKIIYSYLKESDLGLNVLDSELKLSNFAKSVRNAKSTKSITISDFQLYAPSQDLPSSFATAPIIKENEIRGYLTFQINANQLGKVFQEKSNLGESAQSYLIGEDFLLRSKLKNHPAREILRKKIDNRSSRYFFKEYRHRTENNLSLALHQTKNYAGKEVFSAARLLNLKSIFKSDFDLLLISEVEVEEVFAPVRQLIFRIVLLTIILIIVIISSAIYFSKSFSKPILALSQFSDKVSQGDFGGKIEINNQDELGRLAYSLQIMKDNLQQTIKQAEFIADGDYSTLITPKSENDSLALAINAMTKDLQEKDQYTTTLLNSTQAGVVLINSQNRQIEYVNPVASQITGFESSEIIGKSYEKIFYSNSHEDSPKLNLEMEQEKIESKITTKDGIEIYILITIKPISVGQKDLMVATFIDISEIKAMQATLLEEEKKYRTMFQASPAAIILTDKKSVVIDLNNKVKEWLGYEPQDIIGKRVLELDFITKESKLKIVQEQRKRQNSKADSSYLIDFFDHKHEIRTGKLLVNQVYDNRQNHVLNVITIIDITQEKEFQAKIKQQQIKYQSIFDSVGDAIFLISEGKFIDCNQAAVEMFKLKSKADFMNTSPAMISPPRQPDGEDSSQKTQDLMQKAMEEGSAKSEWIHQRKDGKEFPCDVVLTKIELPDEIFIHAGVRDITARKVDEKKILDTKKKLQQVMNASSPIIAIDADYTISDLNPAMLKILDLKNVNSAIGKKCFELLDFDCCGTEDCFLKQTIKQGKTVEQELSCNLDNGKIRYCKVTANPIKDDSGKTMGVVESFTDTTEIKQNEQQIREINKKISQNNWLISSQKALDDELRGDLTLQKLSQKIVSFLAKITNSQIGTIYLWSEQTRSFSFSASYMIEKSQLEENYKPGEGMVGEAAQSNEIINLDNLAEIPHRLQTMAGEIAPKNLLVVPLSYQKLVLGVLELGSIEKYSEKFLAFIDSIIKDLGLAIDLALTREASRELLEETQQQAAELETQQEELRVTNETLAKNSEDLSKASASLKLQQEELKAINEELEEKTEFLEQQRKEIKEKNEVLEQAKADLKDKAQKLELASKYKSEFLANMSHELRTPLNSLLILSNNLAKNKRGNLEEKQVESAKIINSSGKDLLNLINEILDLSKIEAGKMKVSVSTFQLVELQQNITRNFSHQFQERNLELKFQFGENLPQDLTTDLQRLQQIIKNLLSNALKFTSSGYIEISFQRPGKELELQNAQLDKDKSIAISVRDTGIGIKPDKLQAIFEAFQQEDGSTSRKYGGTGLGLSISRELAKLLGGEIQLRSTVGEGSTFTIIIPQQISEASDEEVKTEISASTDKQNKKEPKNKQTSEANKQAEKQQQNLAKIKTTAPAISDDRDTLSEGDKTVLVIEDDPNFAKILRDVAHEKSMKFIHAGDGESGLDMIRKYLPDSIILDINLPGINGWEVLEILKEDSSLRHIPVHIMSANDMQNSFYDKGAAGYLTKPVKPEDLDASFQRIQTYLDKKIHRILIVEDNADTRKVIKDIIGDSDTVFETASRGEVAIEKIAKSSFDCIILDIGLPDYSGFELLQKFNDMNLASLPPIIIYTGRDISREEENRLRKYSQSIIIKGEKSAERLVDEVALYLHQVVKDLPEEKQNMIQMLHNSDDMFSGKNILVVDDDIRNVFAVTGALEDYDMNVFSAANGKEAVDFLQADNSIDLVLMDIMMPVMDGYEAMREIRKSPQLKNLPIIALTAKAMRGDKDICIEAGANDYLAKPLDVNRLISMMRVWIYK